MLKSLNVLPPEIVQQILSYTSADTLINFEQVNRKCGSFVTQFLWRHFCQKDFHYWDPASKVIGKFEGDINAVDWKKEYTERRKVDAFTTRTLDEILTSQTSRASRSQAIIEKGYNVKDTLLRHMQTPDDAEDVLARRYYAEAVLALLHRTMAVEEWSKLRGDPYGSTLERSLVAFDMFVLRDRLGDFEEISACLDAIAQRVCVENPIFHEKSTREKVLMLLQYLSSHQLIGVRQKESYHDLQNNFIGIALLGPDHASLPLISAAIFSSAAKRLGLNAHPCAFPFHVLSIIHAPTGQDLNGNVAPANAPHEIMYVDPFQSTEEVPVEDLLKELRQMGTATATHATYLGATAPPEMVLRTGRNILNSVQHLNTQAGGFGTRSRLAIPDVDNAFYAALWGSIMIGDNNEVAYRRRRNYLQHIIQHFESHNPNDVSLVEKYIMPLFEGHEEHEQLRDIVRATKGTDMMPKTSKRRSPEIAHDVKYKIGQVFRHKRYQYEGVITGWDVKCSASEDWIAQMRVNDLDRGANQSFYHVLSGGESSAPYRYVAEDNILIITPDYPEPLMWVAGRHFKRWDKVMHCFISNVRDEYPDD